MFNFDATPGLTSREAIIDLLAKTGYGMRPREIARALGVNASTVSRRIRDLRAEGWVVTTAELQDLPVTGEERDLHMTLNPDRPGLQEYLTWMYIEHGTDAQPFRWFIKELRSGYNSRPLVRADRKVKKEPISTVVRRLLPDLGGEPIAAPHYRALTAPVIEVLNWPLRTEHIFQSLYRAKAGSAERYRDFIHLMIHVSEELRGLPAAGDETDARPELAELAVAAHHNALVLSERAQVLYEAAVIARHRDRSLAQLAGWARNQLFPGAEPQSYLNGGEELQAAERVRHIYAQIEVGSTSGRRYYGIGGTPGRNDVGGGGDGLLAQMMLDQAHRSQDVVNKIAAMPGMAQVLGTKEVAAHLNKEGPQEFRQIDVAGDDVHVGFISYSSRSHDIGEETENTTVQEQKVAGQDLRKGDRILAIDDRKLAEPLDVEGFDEPGRVILAKDVYTVPVTTAGLFDNKAVTILRRAQA